MRGELTLGSTDGTARRKISAATCDEAVDALTLIAALLTHPSSERVRETTTSTPQSAALSASPSAPRGSAEKVPSSARARAETRDPKATPQEPAREDAPPSPATKPIAPAPPAMRLEARADEEPSEETEVPTARVQRHYVRRGEVVLSSLLASGVTPAVRLGAAIEGALGWASGTLDLVLLLGMRIALPYTVHSDEGSARFGWASGVAGGCIGARARAPLTFAGCMTSELGMITAAGQHTDAPARARPLWAAIGPALRVSYAPHRMLLLAGTLTTLFSTARDRFLVADRELHRVPLLTFRCELGVGVRFE